MAHDHEDGNLDATGAEREPNDPPYQALFPNLDKVSRESFRSGTVSRRRINRALGFLGAVVAIAVALALFADVLFGPDGPLR